MKTIIGVRVKLCYQFKINFTLTQLFHEMKIGGLGLSLNYELAVFIQGVNYSIHNSRCDPIVPIALRIAFS